MALRTDYDVFRDGCLTTPCRDLGNPHNPYTNAYANGPDLMIEVKKGSFVRESVAARMGLVTASQRATPEAKAARRPARLERRRRHRTRHGSCPFAF